MPHDLSIEGIEQARALTRCGSGAHRDLLARSHISTVSVRGVQVNVLERIREYPKERP